MSAYFESKPRKVKKTHSAPFCGKLEGVLYFKVDDSNRAAYEKAGSRPFTYTAKGNKKVSMSYWEVPADVLEDREALEEWAGKSLRIRPKTARAKRSR